MLTRNTSCEPLRGVSFGGQSMRQPYIAGASCRRPLKGAVGLKQCCVLVRAHSPKTSHSCCTPPSVEHLLHALQGFGWVQRPLGAGVCRAWCRRSLKRCHAVYIIFPWRAPRALGLALALQSCNGLRWLIEQCQSLFWSCHGSLRVTAQNSRPYAAWFAWLHEYQLVSMLF